MGTDLKQCSHWAQWCDSINLWWPAMNFLTIIAALCSGSYHGHMMDTRHLRWWCDLHCPSQRSIVITGHRFLSGSFLNMLKISVHASHDLRWSKWLWQSLSMLWHRATVVLRRATIAASLEWIVMSSNDRWLFYQVFIISHGFPSYFVWRTT